MSRPFEENDFILAMGLSYSSCSSSRIVVPFTIKVVSYVLVKGLIYSLKYRLRLGGSRESPPLSLISIKNK